MMTAKNQEIDRKLKRLSREILDVAYALYDADTHSEPLPFRELYRHKKTGGIYEVICNATRESDGVLLVVYKNTKTGDRWVRPSAEFCDGRFELLE